MRLLFPSTNSYFLMNVVISFSKITLNNYHMRYALTYSRTGSHFHCIILYKLIPYAFSFSYIQITVRFLRSTAFRSQKLKKSNSESNCIDDVQIIDYNYKWGRIMLFIREDIPSKLLLNIEKHPTEAFMLKLTFEKWKNGFAVLIIHIRTSFTSI